jgi:virginiamycin B lyase
MYRTTRVLFSAALIGLGLPALAQAQIEGPNELPDGDAKNLVQGICVACHEVSLITGSVGYTQDEWRYLFGHMINLSEPIADQISAYLAANFPPSGARKPVLIPGDEVVTFKEWFAPTLGQRPRDPLMHSDGTIWWAGMFGSLVGMLDPASGEMKEYRLDPTARPHSITEGPDGDVWYSGNSNSTIGRIDRQTGEITVYPLNNPKARDPHTMAFAEDGTLWFTVQNSNMLGRLEPDTGDVWLTDMPTARARPYGIRRDSEGNLWIAYRGAYKIARVNPETREITEFESPNYGKDPGKGHFIRRLAIDAQDNVWYVDSGLGEIGRFDPKTETFKQWPSPSGIDSHPYAIEVIDGVVWYNESDVRPDTLVRFDPATEQYQSWEIPSGIGIIRNMSKTPDGNLVIHQSSTNTVGLVIIGKENNARYSENRVSQR